MRIIAIANQKGGAGKTTTSINLSACLTELGKKVLFIDLDPQGNATKGMKITAGTHSIYELLTYEEQKVNEYILNTSFQNLDIIPADIRLADAEIEMGDMMCRETILKDILNNSKELKNYDYVIIDCNPSLGLLTINAIAACSDVLIPVEASSFGIDGIERLFNTISKIKKKLRSNVHIMGCILTRVNMNTNIAKDYKKELGEVFQDKIFKVIHNNVKIPEAQKAQVPINYYDKRCTGCIEYLELAKEVIAYGT